MSLPIQNFGITAKSSIYFATQTATSQQHLSVILLKNVCGAIFYSEMKTYFARLLNHFKADNITANHFSKEPLKDNKEAVLQMHDMNLSKITKLLSK